MRQKNRRPKALYALTQEASLKKMANCYIDNCPGALERQLGCQITRSITLNLLIYAIEHIVGGTTFSFEYCWQLFRIPWTKLRSDPLGMSLGLLHF